MLLKLFSTIYLFFLCLFFIFSSNAIGEERHFPKGTENIFIVNNGVRSDLLQNIAPLVEKSIAEGYYPGAVILASHRGHIIYRGVFGNRRIIPDVAPMKVDTIFDIASLTKVIATTPAIMQLVEQGKLDLDAPAKVYWPAFSSRGKDTITIRELLTHTSGLPADLSLSAKPIGEMAVLQKIEKLKLVYTPGTHFFYSDLNFVVLAYLVEIITGESFAQYTQTNIFNPLGMKDTVFLPPQDWRDRIAPTEMIDNKMHWGEVHDPTSYVMGGVAGNAGLFSTANDLSLFADCILNGGRLSHAQKNKKPSYLLGPLTILKMITPQTPHALFEIRGLGWDIDSPLSNRGVLFPIESFGHSGWTGTSIWIDPVTQTWLIILTSRTHPTPANSNQLVEDRRAIADIISGSLTDVSLSSQNDNTGRGELQRAYPKG